jgi:hypothetical protein
VAKDATRNIDPVGKLELRTGRADKAPAARPGEALSIRPELFTGDGLLINTVYLGRSSDSAGYGGCSASVELRARDETILDHHDSGFA